MLWFVRVIAATGLTVAIVLLHTWILRALHVGPYGVIAPELVEAVVAFAGTALFGCMAAAGLAGVLGGLGTAGSEAEPGCLAGCATAVGSGLAIIGLTLGAAALSWKLEPGLLAAASVAFVTFPCVVGLIAGEEGVDLLHGLLG